MKKFALLPMLGLIAPFAAANAADITLYYSPSCPHCHHAREFIADRLVYEYPSVSVTAINVMNGENLPLFQDALKKCDYSSGGVPVLVIGDKCFQGYADFMQDELRDAVSVDLSDSQKKTASENKQALDTDADAFRADHASRSNVIQEYSAADTQKKTVSNKSGIYFYALLIILVAALGYILLGGRRKK